MAEYAHPLEHLIANVLPIMLPLALKRTHFLSLFIFSIFELWEAAADHSGYDFLKLPPTELHDLHHSKFRVNLSTLGLMDWIHGTKDAEESRYLSAQGTQGKEGILSNVRICRRI